MNNDFTEDEIIELAKLIGQHKLEHERLETTCLPSCFKFYLRMSVNSIIDGRELTTSTGLMTDEEHHAMEMSAQLWNYINRHVVIAGHTRDSDLREIMFHIHGIQRALLGQAAARAYPDRYRLLGGQIAGEGDEVPAAPWTNEDLAQRALDAFRMYGSKPTTSAMNFPMVHVDGRYPWGTESEARRTDEVSHILTLVTEQPICKVPRSAIGFVKAVNGGPARACKDCLTALDELGFRTIDEE